MPVVRARPMRASSPSVAPVKPKEDVELSEQLGAPCVLDYEDLRSYLAFARSVEEMIGPIDVIEKIHVRDYVHYRWEVERLRRLKAKFLQSATRDGLSTLRKYAGEKFPATGPLSDEWFGEPAQSVANVNQQVRKAGFDDDVIMAHTLAQTWATLITSTS